MSILDAFSRERDSDSEPELDLSPPEVYSVLSSERRRLAIRVLAENGAMTHARLAEEIGAREHDTEPDALGSQQRKRIYIGLYQCHLEKLIDAGLVKWERTDGLVRPTDRLETVADIDADVTAQTEGGEHDE